MEDRTAFYHVKVKRGWFRGRDVFTERLVHYERMLLSESEVRMPLNAGNMIYIMMRQLEQGVDWEKQDALVSSYRDLMYRMSYVDVMYYRNDMAYLHIKGDKDDVMWALSFITQVYPEDVLQCYTVEWNDSTMEEDMKLACQIQNGMYIGGNAIAAQSQNALPNIWDRTMHEVTHVDMSEGVCGSYDPLYQPESGESFVLPDGRMASYIRMDERFYHAERMGVRVDAVMRHNISASLMKDFEDMVTAQARIDYDVYQMRYVAFMTKVHELEALLHGLEVSAYDVLPIGERGLPCASDDTIRRTNAMDCNSIKYTIERLQRESDIQNRKELVKEVSRSILRRLDGYDMEYQTYQMTGTPVSLCMDIRNQRCQELYLDVGNLESYRQLRLTQAAYRALCNDPKGSVYQMTEFERQKLRIFGRGYLDFLKRMREQACTQEEQYWCSNGMQRLTQYYLVQTKKKK